MHILLLLLPSAKFVLAQGWARCLLSCFYSLCLFLFESKLPARAIYDMSQAVDLAACGVVLVCHAGMKTPEGKLLYHGSTGFRAVSAKSFLSSLQNQLFYPPQNNLKSKVVIPRNQGSEK